MATSPETCDLCAFRSDAWTVADTIRTIRAAPRLLDLWTHGMSNHDRDRRPDPETWSVNEYVDHLRETFFGLRVLIEVARAEPGTDLGPAFEAEPPGEPRSFADVNVREGFASEAEAMATLLIDLGVDEWARHAVLGGGRNSIDWAARHAVHDFWHHLTDIATIRTDLDDGIPAQRGGLDQISVSNGGVPKAATERAAVAHRGIEGDAQRARAHHGAPWQALCLWSTEVISSLAEEGHLIRPGDAGENLTLGGIDWATLRAGTVLEIGPVRIQLSAPATPCAKNNRWFTDGDSGRIDHDRHPGWSRWYASVLHGGSIRRGDDVAVVA